MIRLEIDYSRRNVGVDVYIWDKNENRFEQIDALFDTGAHTCAIDTDLLLRLGYNLDGAVKSYISTASSPRETAHRIRIDKIMLDETLVESVLFNAFEFPMISRPIILGMNIIRQFEVNMNFRSRLITMRKNYLDKNDSYYDSDIFGDWRADNADLR